MASTSYAPSVPVSTPGMASACANEAHPQHYVSLARARCADLYFGAEVNHDKDFVATTLAYHLDLRGPAETVATACSSSLVAVSRAVHAIRLGLCDVAICGGASCSPDTAMRVVDGMIWAADGVCRPFSDAAAGTVPADGSALLVLTAGQCARAYATLKGVGVNNDGARKGTFSQPSEAGQVEVMRMALSDADLAAEQVDYVEAHGTGTRVGDPIEVGALAALHRERGEANRLVVGSIKGHIGHTNTVAGAASLVKAVLCVWHRAVPPTAYTTPLNQLIPWSEIPIEVAGSGGGRDCIPRVVGVSSFGIGGTNAHVIIAAAPPPDSPEEPARRVRRTKRTPLPPPRPAQMAVSSSDGPASDSDGELCRYEVAWEAAEVAEAPLDVLPIVCDGDAASFVESLQLPCQYVFVAWRDATAAATLHGALALAGSTSTLDGADELLWRTLALLVELGSAAGQLHVFALLADTPRYALLRGLLRVARKEQPRLAIRSVCISGTPPPHGRGLLSAMPLECRVRDGALQLPRLSRVLGSEHPPAAIMIKVETALVTGGLKGLGLRVASWLLKTGRAKRVVLVGRSGGRSIDDDWECVSAEEAAASAASADPAVGASGANASDARLLKELLGGSRVDAVQCDVAEWHDVERLPEAQLVLHCAGVIDDQLMSEVTERRAKALLRPKLAGTLHLQRRYPAAQLLCFSSSSALLGPVGQATYAAANAFLDELLGGRAVQWGGWAGAGMAAAHGIEPLAGERFCTVEAGLAQLGALLDAPPASSQLVLDIPSWPVFAQHASLFAAEDAHLLSALVAPPPLGDAPPAGLPTSLSSNLHLFRLELGPGCATPEPWRLLQQHCVEGRPIMPASACILIAGLNPSLEDPQISCCSRVQAPRRDRPVLGCRRDP